MQSAILKEVFPLGIDSLYKMLKIFEMKQEDYALSEYQLYGCYIVHNYRSKFKIGKWNNFSSRYLPMFNSSDLVEKKFAVIQDLYYKYDSVSFHTYLRGIH